MESWHRQKSDELDALLRDHFAHHGEKQLRLDASNRALRVENDTLNQNITYLTAELDKCRDSFRAFKSDAHAAQLREQALAVRQQQLLRLTEVDLLRKKEDLDRLEADVRQRLCTVAGREKEVESSWERYYEARSTLDMAMTMAEKQSQADVQRAQLLRERTHAASHEAHSAIAADRDQLHSSEESLRFSVSMMQVALQEADRRSFLERCEIDDLRQLLRHHDNAMRTSLANAVGQHNASARELSIQRELVALKERELTVRLRHEREALRECVERHDGDRVDFQLECQRIVRQLKSLTTDLVPCSGGSPTVLDELVTIQASLDTLYSHYAPTF